MSEKNKLSRLRPRINVPILTENNIMLIHIHQQVIDPHWLRYYITEFGHAQSVLRNKPRKTVTLNSFILNFVFLLYDF